MGSVFALFGVGVAFMLLVGVTAGRRGRSRGHGARRGHHSSFDGSPDQQDFDPNTAGGSGGGHRHGHENHGHNSHGHGHSHHSGHDAGGFAGGHGMSHGHGGFDGGGGGHHG